MVFDKIFNNKSSKAGDQRTMKRRVAFLSLVPHVGAMPAVVSAVTRLVESGYEVDFITVDYATHIPVPNFPKEKVNVIFLPIKGRRGIVPGFLQFLARAVRLLRKRGHYVCFIGVDQRGMILAVMAGMFLRTRVIYYSMELYLANETHGFSGKVWKKLECISNQRTWLTLMQDWERATLLIEDNQISQSQIMIVPNSPFGKAERHRGTYFNEKFGIDSNRKIILYAGNIINWAMSLELVESALTWPDEWVLVLHGYIQSTHEAYLRQIKRLAKGPQVVISLDMVSYKDVGYLHESADIGVALYAPDRHNRETDFTNIAYASGKLIRYLKCGLPVVTSDSPGLRMLIEQYQCGIHISNANEIKSAITHILDNYDEFSSNAVKTYNEEFEFTKYFDKVIDRINEI